MYNIDGDDMVSILIDTKYSGSLWCDNLLKGLTSQLRQKRIPFCEIYDICPADTDAVFIIASDYEWTNSAIKQLNTHGITPILLCNQFELIHGLIYNCVCSDINGSMKNLLDSLKANGKNRIAIYGVNTNSISDIGRVDGLFSWKDDYFDTMQVFVNDGSLEKCYKNFEKRLNDFDAVICANDFAAVSLVKRLKSSHKEILNRLTVISCSKAMLSEYYKKYIVSLDMNFEQYGKAAVYIYECISKNPYVSAMTLQVKWSLTGTDKIKKHGDIPLLSGSSNDKFYSDCELKEMMTVDKYLNIADTTDKKIIDLSLSGATLNQIAENCFLTVGGIKYRIKKLVNECGTQSKEELFNCIKKYIF